MAPVDAGEGGASEVGEVGSLLVRCPSCFRRMLISLRRQVSSSLRLLS